MEWYVCISDVSLKNARGAASLHGLRGRKNNRNTLNNEKEIATSPIELNKRKRDEYYRKKG